MSAAAENTLAIDTATAPPRHIDFETAELDRLARAWIDLQQTRKALAQRELPEEIVAEFERLEGRVSAMLTRALRRHVLWPWLSQFPGLGGAHAALIIGRIGDPRRYPGQRCSAGHYLPPLYVVGSPCLIVADADVAIDHVDGDDDAGVDANVGEIDVSTVCPGVMREPRSGSGVRSLWHWAGLHVGGDGRAPRKRKGVKATWEPRARASVMQPGGIAEQIVRLSVPHYVDVYRAAKARLVERVEGRAESDRRDGALLLRAAAEIGAAIENCSGSRPLRPHEADRIARKIAAKAFLGDLLVEWKRLAAPPDNVLGPMTGVGGGQ